MRVPLAPEVVAELLDSMPEGEAKDLVRNGTYYIASPGRVVGKPVLRWADGPLKGKPGKGTGTIPGAIERATEASKEVSFKRTRAYRELLEQRYDAEKVEWLFTSVESMVEGETVMVDAYCPCGCDHKFRVEAYKKGNPLAAKLIWEAILGRAGEKKEVDINIRSLIARLDSRQSTGELEIVDVSPLEVAERMALAAAREAVEDAIFVERN